MNKIKMRIYKREMNGIKKEILNQMSDGEREAAIRMANNIKDDQIGNLHTTSKESYQITCSDGAEVTPSINSP